uniref:non-specific serine/threonine protein kinase n=1 Tax=Oryza barthii TaxID=65489 RepID=A0A0D3HIA6_9ORYZ
MPPGGEPDPAADELQSLSFASSDRSRSRSASTVSTATTTSTTTTTTTPPRLGAVALSDIRFLKRLGAGDIGSVYLAEVRGAATALVAAKVMDRKELEGRNKEGRARTEREILEAVDHPFLPRLFGVAEGDRWSCLLTEFCPGGDLHVLRQRQPHRRFSESAVRFYAAEVVAALEYVHMVDIVYRDLKPENVLVRADGHIMLTDFDLSLQCAPTAPTPAHVISDPIALAGGHSSSSSSCIIPSCIVPAVSCFQLFPRRRRRRWRGRKKPSSGGGGNGGGSFPSGGLELEFVAEPVELRSMSFVGTHEYLAPEIVSGEGHGSSVDWWTLGVFVFELLYGLFPRRRRRRWRGRKKPSSGGGGNGGGSFPSGGLELEFVAEPVELRSMSFVGTHEYLAPEIVSGEGHGSSVDWWTLGVFVFELLYGVTPFKGHDNEMTLANIVARALEFPREPPVSAAAKDLVTSLLAKDPARRLGATVGAAAIKRHPFFGGVNWALLRCATPPYVPPTFSVATATAANAAGANAGMSDDDDDDSCPGTPVEYY